MTTMSYLSHLILLIPCLTLQANQADDLHPKSRPVLAWKVTHPKNNKVVYFAGSIHFFKKEFYPLPSVIETAFEASDVLAVEVDITAYAILQKNQYPEDHSRPVFTWAFQSGEGSCPVCMWPFQFTQGSQFS